MNPFSSAGLSKPVIFLGSMFVISATSAAVGAATAHRLAVSQGTGSEGAYAFTNASSTGGALEASIAATPNTTFKIPFGIIGEYNASSSTFGIGVGGISTTGYGVAAEALSTSPALIALGKGNGDAADVFAYGTGGALVAQSVTAKGGAADLGLSTGEGIVISGNSGNANANAAATIDASANTMPLVVNQTFADGFSYTNLALTSTSLDRSGSIDDGDDLEVFGDVYLRGRVYVNCAFGNSPPLVTAQTACNDVPFSSSLGTSGVTRTNAGADVATYSAKQSVPTVEDVGGGRLVAGSAVVRLDPTFARTISTTQPYRVFLTPNGDNRGLYVAQKTATAFVVRESSGGRSTLDFDYRIVAAPFADRSVRFPAVPRAAHGRTVRRGNAAATASDRFARSRAVRDLLPQRP